jgi:hypothetical protein
MKFISGNTFVGRLPYITSAKFYEMNENTSTHNLRSLLTVTLEINQMKVKGKFVPVLN